MLEFDTYIIDLSRFINSYGGPHWDSSQDLTSHQVEHGSGILEAHFTKPLASGDDDDANLKEECYTLVFPVGGGPVQGGDQIGKHTNTPVLSKSPICFKGILGVILQPPPPPHGVLCFITAQ